MTKSAEMETKALGKTGRAEMFNEIARHAPYIDGKQANGDVVVRLGLICTVYFRHGGKPEVGNKVLRCFDRFANEFGEHLQGQFREPPGGRFTSLRPDSIAKAREKLKIEVDQGLSISWVLQSERTSQIAAEYSIKTLTEHADMVDATLSYLKLQLPWRMLETEAGERQFLDWVSHLCNELNIEQGYAGLCCNFPYDFDLYQPYEFQITQRYSGLMVDSYAFWDCAALEDGIKSVSWLTLLGGRYIKALGGREALKRRLRLPDVDVQETEKGHFIIRAGLLPAVGGQIGKPEAQPPAYVAVNRVLKPVRLAEEHQEQLHSSMDDAEGYTKKTTAIWYARFDEPETTSDARNKIPSSVPGGKPCTKAGRWATLAQPGSARNFEEGEIMPDFPGSSYGATFWQWVGPSDDKKR